MGILTFTKMYSGAIPPMRADKAALGYMPTSAYQYCEAMRVASSLGWYVFPPTDIQLLWNGADVFHWEADEWRPLSFAHLPGNEEEWDRHAPPGFEGLAPPYLRALPAPGVVQVWSGWLWEATEGCCGLVRPLVNVHRSRLYHCFEGVVEIDRFRPSPLFINLQLCATNVPIGLSRLDPLFQVQALPHSCVAAAPMHVIRNGFDADAMGTEDWAAFRCTIRTNRADESHRLGDYAAETRKRAKAQASPTACPMHGA